MTKMASRPKTVTVFYRGIPYLLDLVRCRRAVVNRQVEGELSSMESLAQAVGISRSTASRFFSGKATSLTVTLKILGVLKLRFDEVATPQTEGEEKQPYRVVGGDDHVAGNEPRATDGRKEPGGLGAVRRTR